LVALENIVPIAIHIHQFHPILSTLNHQIHVNISMWKRMLLDVSKTSIISTQRRIGIIDYENIITMNKEEEHIKLHKFAFLFIGHMVKSL
jgi:hypothetical protein